LGLFEKRTTLGRLPTAQYVVVPNVEVRQGEDLLSEASLTAQ